jgi:hypothetical protein
LIVAGGPAHAHGMARPGAHQSLAKDDSYDKYGPVLPGRESLRGWVERLPSGRAKTAAFDTRFDKPAWLTGSAAKQITRRLRGKGYPVIGGAELLRPDHRRPTRRWRARASRGVGS